MVIQENCVVSIHYTLTNKTGEVLDSSTGKEPLHYLHGAANIIPGLEKELAGKTSGDHLNVTVPPDQAYGEHQQQLVQQVPRDAFQGIERVEAGMQFQAETDNGTMHVVVTEVDEDNVTVDGNHPLAGETLNFDVSVEEVREATSEEVAHGHPHQGDQAH